MTEPMKTDVPPCPIDIGAFRTQAVMLVSDADTQLIEKFRLLIWYRIGHALFPFYLILFIRTVLCRSRIWPGLWRIKGICITAAGAHNGADCPDKYTVNSREKS